MSKVNMHKNLFSFHSGNLSEVEKKTETDTQSVKFLQSEVSDKTQAWFYSQWDSLHSFLQEHARKRRIEGYYFCPEKYYYMKGTEKGSG